MKTDVISNKRDIRILKAGRRKRTSGVNLIEVMTVTAILTITVVGASGYRYYSSLNAHWAKEQITAVILLTLTGMALLNLGFQSRISAIRTAQGIQARWAADAGLIKAIVDMNNELTAKTWSDTSMPTATNEVLFQSDQSFSYQVDKDYSGTYTVTSTGIVKAINIH